MANDLNYSSAELSEDADAAARYPLTAPVATEQAQAVAWQLLFTNEDDVPCRETFYCEDHLNRHVQHNTNVRNLRCVVVPMFAAPVAASPEAAPAAMEGSTPRVDALMEQWEDDGATRGPAFIELRDLARELERCAQTAATPAAPSAVRAKFEAWLMRANKGFTPEHFLRHDGGSYIDSQLNGRYYDFASGFGAREESTAATSAGLAPAKETERENFEMFWRDTMNIEVLGLGRKNYPFTEPEDQPYECHDTGRAWDAWQARAALPQSYTAQKAAAIREAFEADWFEGVSANSCLRERDGASYKDEYSACAWSGWESAWKLALAQPAPVQSARITESEARVLNEAIRRYAMPDQKTQARLLIEALAKAAPVQQDAPAPSMAGDGSTPGPWRVEKRERDGEMVMCWVAAPDCNGFAYAAEILGDDEYRDGDEAKADGMARRLADCELIVKAVAAHRAAISGQKPAEGEKA